MDGQQIIQTGPYAFVRHPMYAGAILIIFAAPLALNSFWGLAASCVLGMVVIFRLLDEERFLRDEFAQYEAYCRQTKYRLIPYIW